MKGDGHRNWANAHHRAALQKKRGRFARSGGDRVVSLLCAALVLFVGLTVFFWPAGFHSEDQPTAGGAGFSCQASSITDEDTLRCADGTRVRLHAVEARESDGRCLPGHPCSQASAQAATDRLAQLAGGQICVARRPGPVMGE